MLWKSDYILSTKSQADASQVSEVYFSFTDKVRIWVPRAQGRKENRKMKRSDKVKLSPSDSQSNDYSIT